MKNKKKSPAKLKSWSRIKNDLESALTTWEGNSHIGRTGQNPSEKNQTRSGNLNQEQLQKIKKLLNSITQQLDALSTKV
ncbi:MAG: hypothetical protein JNM39_12715 [Bdellovibrionaceae bacterium]|nr:hypothetical protein [Pseudobdellovibrionaceae bacterium]